MSNLHDFDSITDMLYEMFLVATIDAMSAACLLERYIDDEGGGSLSARPCGWPIRPENEIFDYEVVKDHIRKLYYSNEDANIPKVDVFRRKFSLYENKPRTGILRKNKLK